MTQCTMEYLEHYNSPCTEGVEAGTVEADQLSVAERGYPRPVFDEGLPGHAVPPSLALTESAVSHSDCAAG